MMTITLTEFEKNSINYLGHRTPLIITVNGTPHVRIKYERFLDSWARWIQGTGGSQPSKAMQETFSHVLDIIRNNHEEQ